MASKPSLRYGSTGPSVVELQSLLNSAPDGLGPPLGLDGVFGPKTFARVKEFQAQGTPKLTADGIVGPLTWGKLLAEGRREDDLAAVASGIRARGQGLVGVPTVSRFALAADQKKAKPNPKIVVVTEQSAPWRAWAKQFQAWPFAGLVEIVSGVSLDAAAAKLEEAARMAGPGGAILLSVGHGGSGSAGFGPTDEGFFDLAPSGFRVAGNNAVLTGGAGKVNQVSVFYDKVPSFGGTVKAKSRKQEDEERAKSNNPKISGPAKTRLAHFNRYLQVGKTIRANGVGAIILLTCKVGRASDFLTRARKQLGAPIGAYKRQVAGQQVVSGRARMFLVGDGPGSGTNIEMGEFWIPMPPLQEWTAIP